MKTYIKTAFPIFIFFTSLIFLVSSCFKIPDNLVMPQWDTDLNLPITNRTYTLGDIIGDSKYIHIDSSQGVHNFIITSDTLRKDFSMEEYCRNKLDNNYTGIQLIVAQGTASVEFALANGMELDSASMGGGSIKIDIYNTSNNTFDGDVMLPGFITPSGNQFKMSIKIQGKSSYSTTQDMSGFTYSSSQQPDKNKITVTGQMHSGNFIDTLNINVRITNSYFLFFKGIIPTTEISPVLKSISLPVTKSVEKFRDKVNLGNPQLTLTGRYISQNNNPFSVLLKNVMVEGIRTDGQNMFLQDLAGNNNLGEFLIPNGQIIKTFSNENSNLSAFLKLIPDSLRLTANVIVNPDNKTGSVSSNDSVKLSLFFNAGDELTMTDVVYEDSVAINLSQSNREDIRNGKMVDITIELTNNLPLSISCDLDFQDSLKNSIFIKKNVVSMGGATVDAFGNASHPAFTKTDVLLDSLDIINFTNTSWLKFILYVNTSDTQKSVVVHPDDWLKIVAYCKLKYHLKQK